MQLSAEDLGLVGKPAAEIDEVLTQTAAAAGPERWDATDGVLKVLGPGLAKEITSYRDIFTSMTAGQELPELTLRMYVGLGTNR